MRIFCSYAKFGGKLGWSLPRPKWAEAETYLEGFENRGIRRKFG
jgi:hypothetical protein